MAKKKKTGNNPRKGMKLYHIWISEEDEDMINKYFDSLPSVIWKIFVEAKKRGDFYSSEGKK